MIQFFKDAIREIKHVVWPTEKETRSFFVVVLALLIFFTLYLFAFSNLFSNIVFALKSVLPNSGGYTQTVDPNNIFAPGNTDITVEQMISNEAVIGDSAPVVEEDASSEETELSPEESSNETAEETTNS